MRTSTTDEPIDAARMGEYVFRLLSPAEEAQIERAIREDAGLARLEGEWIDVLGRSLKVNWDGPVPEVADAIHARLFGQDIRRAPLWRRAPMLAVALGFGIVLVLMAKLYAINLFWPFW